LHIRLFFPIWNRRRAIFVRYEGAAFDELIFVNVARAIAESFLHFDPHDELGFDKIVHQRIVGGDRCRSMNSQSPAFHEVDEEHADAGIFDGISPGEVHAVAVVIGNDDGAVVDCANEAGIAAAICARRLAVFIGGGEEKHIRRFDERFLFWIEKNLDHFFAELIGEAGGVELFLQFALTVVIYGRHGGPRLVEREDKSIRRCGPCHVRASVQNCTTMEQGFQPEIRVLPTIAEVAEEAARRVTEASADAIANKDSFSIALSGGHTPEKLFELLATEPYVSQIDWSRVQIFFGDERCVPPDHPDSNFRMANEALLKKVPIPKGNIFRMRGEIDPNEAAIEYGQLLKEKFGDGGLDMILLGMGDDGHTASLFPHSQALKETKHRCVANYVEKFKTWRITMSAPFINRAQSVMVMVVGADKAARIEEVLQGPRDPERLPIQMISPSSGRMTWLMDVAAAGM
jgi:6-phosphogluconolactonase